MKKVTLFFVSAVVCYLQTATCTYAPLDGKSLVGINNRAKAVELLTKAVTQINVKINEFKKEIEANAKTVDDALKNLEKIKTEIATYSDDEPGAKKLTKDLYVGQDLDGDGSEKGGLQFNDLLTTIGAKTDIYTNQFEDSLD